MLNPSLPLKGDLNLSLRLLSVLALSGTATLGQSELKLTPGQTRSLRNWHIGPGGESGLGRHGSAG